MQDEQKLRDLVKKWTNHFKRRKDFSKWQEERIWQENYQEKEIKFLEKIILDLNNKKILDLGCGMGGFLTAMKRTGNDIIGLEPNPDYCEIAKLRGKRYGLDIKVINGPGEKMPFLENTFDFIYCNDVLEHCESPSRVLKESYRVLKPAGQMYVTVINRFGFKDPHYHLKFINWMPRFLAERYIIWQGMSKDNYLGKDKQRLSEMHYFIFWNFLKMAKKTGFAVEDLNRYKILRPELIASHKFKELIRLLKSLKIACPIYFFVAPFFSNGFKFLLSKYAKSVSGNERP